MILGANFNWLNASRTLTVMKYPWAAVHDAHVFRQHMYPWFGRVRSLLFLAERDAVKTPWLHVPLTLGEIVNVNAFLDNSIVPVELAWGPLWEALWLSDHPQWKPDNPFESPGEITSAFVQTLNSLHASSIHTLDIYNEFDVMHEGPKQIPTMLEWYPAALEWCRRHGVRSTVSTILGTDGDISRVIRSYDWLQVHGGLPDVIEVHANGLYAWRDLATQVLSLKALYQRPVIIGECDVPDVNWKALGASTVEEFIVWKEEA